MVRQTYLPHRGFTLLELMVCLTLFIILALGTYHGGTSLLHRQRHQHAVTTLFHALQYARQEAIYRNTVVGLTPSSFPSCVSPWQHYAIRLRTPSSVLRDYSSLSFSKITTNRPCGIYFSPQGHCLTPGTLTITTSTQVRKIIINNSGRIRLAQ